MSKPVMDISDDIFSQETAEDSSYKLSLTKKHKLQWHSLINGKIVTLNNEPEPRLWRIILSKIFSWLPIQSQL